MRRRIFVFGSNLAGIHGAGAAKYARDHYGAQLHVGEGLTGDSYALPTKDHQLRTLGLSVISGHLTKFAKFASDHPDMDFLFTSVGTGLAGYKRSQIAALVWEIGFPDNVYIQAGLVNALP